MWVARVLKRPVDKDNAPSLSRAESKKLDSELNRSFVMLTQHLRLVATNLIRSPIVRLSHWQATFDGGHYFSNSRPTASVLSQPLDCLRDILRELIIGERLPEEVVIGREVAAV